jgi:hypothetical protein
MFTLVVLAAVTFAGGAQSTSSGPPRGLTSNGRLQWEFEALLHDVFGNRHPYATGTNNSDFSCAGTCVPHVKWSAYVFTFANAHGSSFSLKSRTFGPVAFGNYPIPIRINGRYIACEKSASTFLTNLRGTAGFALLCVKPTP